MKKKPCKSCPFRKDAPLGLWHPEHYIRVAYLGSADLTDMNPMGCHQYNGKTNPKLRGEKIPPCIGWYLSRDSIGSRLEVLNRRIDPNEIDRTFEVMSPEDLLLANGIDLELLPTLEWDAKGKKGWKEWQAEVLGLYHDLKKYPEESWTYVKASSPCRQVISEQTVKDAFGVNSEYFRLRKYNRQ